MKRGLGLGHGFADDGFDVDLGQGRFGDLTGLTRGLGGEVDDVGLIVGPQGGDAQALLGFGQVGVGLDALGAGAELLHLLLEDGGGGFQTGLGGGLLLFGYGGRDRQQGQGGGQGERGEGEGAGHDEAPSADAAQGPPKEGSAQVKSR